MCCFFGEYDGCHHDVVVCFCLDYDFATMVRWKMWNFNFTCLLWTHNWGFCDCCVLVWNRYYYSDMFDICHHHEFTFSCLGNDVVTKASWKTWNLISACLLWTLNWAFHDCCVLVWNYCYCFGKCDGCHPGVGHMCFAWILMLFPMVRCNMWNLLW